MDNQRDRALRSVCALLLILGPGLSYVSAQQPQQRISPDESPVLCTKDDASNLIRQQIDNTRTFDNTVQRISVLLRAADLLWPLDQQSSRRAFIEAFEQAKKAAAPGEKPTREKTDVVGQLDQRYLVLGALRRRDPELARKLTEQLLEEAAAESESEANKSQGNEGTGSKLLDTALVLLKSDVTASLYFAQTSLRYPATVNLPFYLYRLAEIDQAAADRLYSEAFNAYRLKPMDEFVYLSAFPFGNIQEAADAPTSAVYRVPAKFVPNKSLQRLFLQATLSRAEQAAQSAPVSTSSTNASEIRQIWLILTRLEIKVQQELPDLLTSLQQARGSIFSLLSPASQNRVRKSIDGDQVAPAQTFAERVELATKQADTASRDRILISAVLSAKTESLKDLIDAVDKLSDSDLRQPLLDWVYFTGAQTAISDGRFDDAKKLISKIRELDQSAYLSAEIASKMIDKVETQTEAREILDGIRSAAAKAPDTLVKARALLNVAHLYSKLSINEAINVLSTAVDCINHLTAPDFSRDVVIRRIENKTVGAFAAFKAPGFKPEAAFREIGKSDFSGALYLAANFADKSLRALTTLTLSELCLEQERDRAKAKQGNRDPKTRTKPN